MSHIEYMKFDVRAEVYFIPKEDGGRRQPALSGYRPAHMVREDCLTTGIHHYIEKDMALPGESTLADIKFLCPEHYPSCLRVGKVINVQEGGRVVGHAKIQRIYNPILIEE